ncbi:relaxase/mobilization nuclease [Streptomyces sp. NPDC059070]|uniref:relaxase/mobilization nuclease n=1 Tax=Streptomyces sp. NPDC059070 TaxID=3346713 RepID=UPI0036C754A0
MIIDVRARGLGAGAVLSDALGRKVGEDEQLAAEPGGTIVAAWRQLDQYFDDGVWSAPRWAEHLDDPLRLHPFAASPSGDRRAILHLVVRLHPLDRVLEHAEWAGIGHRLAQVAGVSVPGEEGGCRWIAVQAQPGRLDVIANLIRTDGTWTNPPRRLAQLLDSEARRMEADFALHPRDQHLGHSTEPVAVILARLAGEQDGPMAGVRRLIEHAAWQTAALPGAEAAQAGQDLTWAARRLLHLQQDLAAIATRLPPTPAPSLATTPVPLPAPATAHAVTR